MIDSCPQCDYPLKGLPTNHACPECGLRYDAVSQVFKHTRPGLVIGGVGGAGGSVWGFFQLLHLYESAAGVPKALILLALGVLLGGLVWLTFHLYRLHRRGSVAATLPHGLYLRIQKLEGRVIPWGNVSRAAPAPGAAGAVLYIKDKQELMTVQGIFKSRTHARTFVDQVNARISGDIGGVPAPTRESEPPSVGGAPDTLTGQARPGSEEDDDPDATTIALRSHRKRPIIQYPLLIMAAVLAVLILRQVGFVSARWLLIGLLGFAVAYEIYWFFLAPVTPQSLVLNRSGLSIVRGDHELVSLPWVEIEDVICSPWMGDFRLQGQHGSILFSCWYRQLGNRRLVRHCVAEIDRLKQVYTRKGGRV